MINVGVIGLGFMGRTHVSAYQAAERDGFPCRLSAVADRDAARLSGGGASEGNLELSGESARLFDPAQVRGYTDPRELIADRNVHLVSICTHTDTHVDLAIEALRAGKHVLCEKPVAVSSVEVRRLADAAREAGTRGVLCMPAMCMRFWPGWSWLHQAVRSGAYGRVVSAAFQRLGSPPDWGTDFYRDIARTGGPLVDLHIHDTDFIRWVFGAPASVVSGGSLMHVTTLYRYAGGAGGAGGAAGGAAHVVAEGGQDHTPGFGFTMRYVVAFEHATADFDIARTPALMLARNGKREAVTVERGAGYDHQVRHLIDAISAGARPEQLVATMDEAVAVAELLEAERRSLETGQPVAIK
jgi:predicted dehydrogenase